MGAIALLQPPTVNEVEVMQAVLDGFKDHAIARRLGISVVTVRRRVASFLTKVGAANRVQGAVLGVQRGWLQLRQDPHPADEHHSA